MTTIGFILLQFFIIFAAAKLTGELFHRLRQPEVIGELAVGMLLGPFALGFIGEPNASLVEAFHDEATATEALRLVLESVGQLGAIVLLFTVGLETRLSDLLEVGRRAVAVGALGVVAPFVLGYGFMSLTGEPSLDSLFMATAMVATSVGITARVLQELNVLHSTESRIILGAAVLDDVLALLLLATVSGIAGTGAVRVGSIAIILAQAIGFVVFVVLVGRHVFERYYAELSRLHLPDAPLVAALGAMMGMAGMASYFRLAGIIGAFLAGMVFAEFPERRALEERIRPIYHFLVPFFFVLTGAEVDWRVFGQAEIIGMAVGVTLLAIAGKLIAGGVGGWGLKSRSILILGIGMVPRGEVGLIVAGLGLAMGAIEPGIFSVVVIMSIATTLVVPPFLKILCTPEPSGVATSEVERKEEG